MSRLAVERALVEHVLVHASAFEWTLQGFGMLRAYIDRAKTVRLHIWDQAFAVPDVSSIHDHPWDFESVVHSGRLTNVRYVRDELGQVMNEVHILTGEGGGARGEVMRTRWRRETPEVYGAGDVYRQAGAEFHVTLAEPGTVTIIHRLSLLPVPDQSFATVVWPSGPWVSAEPRPATDLERDAIVGNALARWGCV